MIEIIGFDADDTLWINETLYRQTRERFLLLVGNRPARQGVAQRLDEIEIANIEDYGYGIKSFALSMVETAVDVLGDRIRGGHIRHILDLARQMHRAEVRLFDGVEAVLAELATRHTLMLITKGDSFEQERKIRRSGLAGYFRHIEVLGEKSLDSYRALLRKHGIDVKRFIMVGNSLRSDVLPVLALGGTAVYIPHAHTWSHELAAEPSGADGRYFTLDALGDLPPLVKRLELNG